MTTGSASHRKHTGLRIDFIDLLRGWAVLVMIETHVVNATLSAGHFSGPVFQYLKFVNGLVAPSFLFASGLAYAVTTERKAQEYLTFGKPLFKQLWRILSIALIGYLLHVPIFSASRLFTEATAEQWQSFFQVDVLQCIAVSLLLLQVLFLTLRNLHRLSIAAIAGAAGIVVATPALWEIDFWRIIPWPLAAYMNGVRYSLFPLFPWTAFLLAGMVMGHYFLRARERGGHDADLSFFRGIAWLGGSLILLSFLVEPLIPGLRGRTDYWIISPSFFFLRLGIVMILSAGAGSWIHTFPAKGKPFVLLFGRESLLVYVLHLLILYGHFGPFSLARDVNRSFGYPEAAVLTVALIGLMYVVASVWQRTKATRPVAKQIAVISTILLVSGMFLLGPG